MLVLQPVPLPRRALKAIWPMFRTKGKLVVGITNFEPMDYKDEDGKWIGFDADMAAAFAQSIDVDVEFIEIDWDNKIMELDSKNIDCVWNGMTLTDEVKKSIATSNPTVKTHR